MGTNRNEGGRFTPEHTDADVLDAVREHEPAATSEVAEDLGVSRQAADYRLRRLREDGQVHSKKIGASLVWFAPSPERGRERGETPVEADTVDTTERETNRDEPPPAPPDDAAESEDDSETDDLVEAVREYLADPDRAPKKRHAQHAVHDVFTLLREHGTLETNELREMVYPDYTDHYGGERQMWQSIQRYLDDTPGVEKAGYSEWGYAGDDVARQELEG